MSKQSKAHIALGLVAAVLIGVATLGAIVPRSSTSGPVHEIRLVVRDMAYYAEGSSAPNPTLIVRRREQVRIVLRNEDPGMTHDFAVRAWDAKTARLNEGEEGAVQFQAPNQPGLGFYSCTPHGEMMKGTIRVE